MIATHASKQDGISIIDVAIGLFETGNSLCLG